MSAAIDLVTHCALCGAELPYFVVEHRWSETRIPQWNDDDMLSDQPGKMCKCAARAAVAELERKPGAPRSETTPTEPKEPSAR